MMRNGRIVNALSAAIGLVAVAVCAPHARAQGEPPGEPDPAPAEEAPPPDVAEPEAAPAAEEPAGEPVAEGEVGAAVTVEPADTGAQPWSFGIAPRLGLTIPTSKLGPMVVGGVEIDYALPVLDGRLVAALDFSLTRPGHSGSVTDPRVGTAEYDVAETELKIALLGVYRLFGPEHKLIPYGGLGPVLHLLRTTESTDLAPGDNTSQSTNLGLELLAGADYRLGPGYLAGELRFVYSNLDHMLPGDSNAGNVMVMVGYRIVF